MKPYSRDQSLVDRTKAIFNYRLSRARRIVENAFGILSQRFRIFGTSIHLNVDTTADLITTACILHNIIIDEKKTNTKDENDIDESQPSSSESFVFNDDVANTLRRNLESNDSTSLQPQTIRDSFRNYFNTVGAVSWQDESFRL